MKVKVEPEIKKARPVAVDPLKPLMKIDKTSLVYQLEELLFKAALEVVGKRGVERKQVSLDHPAQAEHGDYACNLALRIKTDKYATPWELANAIVNAWRAFGLPESLAKIEVAQPGFINLWLHKSYFVSQLIQVLEETDQYGFVPVLQDKHILLEHTSPNPQSSIMFGHLRNNFLGMSCARLLEAMGAKVVKDAIINDRGTHTCRAIWGYLAFGRKRTGLTKGQLLEFRQVTKADFNRAAKTAAKAGWEQLAAEWGKKKSDWWTPGQLGLKPDHANLVWYVLGSRAYREIEEVKTQVGELLIAWEKKETKVRAAWSLIMDWSQKGYALTYARVGSEHDWSWKESDHWQKGKDMVELGLKKKVFRKSQGAIVTNLASFGLPDTVVVKKDGTALYLTQDLALTKLKMKKFPADLYIWDIGAEQTLYFQQLFAVCEQLGLGKRENYFHLGYALINFKGSGKMSTRTGEVIKADEILDELKNRALAIIKESNQELRGKMTKKQLEDLAEKVAVGAIKYSLLKYSRDTTIYYDPVESLALEGNSGPYLQYTYVRTQSVLAKAENWEKKPDLTNLNPDEEEKALLRTVYLFPEVVLESGENFAPNLLTNFLFDLAQKYNLFYNKDPILKAEPAFLRDFRLLLTAAVGQVIKNGLTLLGVETPERM